MIGPPDLVLFKPLVLIIQHCARNVEQDWNVRLHVANEINEEGVLSWQEPKARGNFLSL